MANVTQLIRRQSSRDLSAQKSIDRLELELEARLVPTAEEVPDYGATNHAFEPSSPVSETTKVPPAEPRKDSVPFEAGGEERESWDSKLQFLLATVGYAVGLGNVWRFPYLAQKNGGGAFLIPYFVMLTFLGLPLFYLELAVGQRIRKGALGAWHQVSPCLGGVGVASAVVSFAVALYYNTVIAWCLYYLFQSFQSPLPWSDCPHAIGVVDHNATTSLGQECERAGPTQFFWYRDALDITPDVMHVGEFNWKIAGCMAIAWLLIYVCIMKGIVASGKVVYVTAVFPYLVLLAFLVRGLTLRGMADGITHLFTPRWEKLEDPVVWLEAGTQIFFSLGLAFGGLIAFGSYNPVNNNCLRDAILVSFTNCVTSLLAGVVVFSILGFKAHETHDRCMAERNATTLALLTEAGDAAERLDLSELLRRRNITLPVCDIQEELQKSAAGTGLAFIIFTEAINQFPLPPLWAVLFFLMLFTLGADSQFGTLEGVISSLIDLKVFPQMRKEALSGLVCLVCFFLSLMFTHGAGNYIFQLFDSFAGNIPLLVIGLFECLGISYIYGIKKFASDVELMCGSRPSLYWLVCWKVVSPLLMVTILAASLIKMAAEGSTYLAWDSILGESINLQWPGWAWGIAAILVILPLMWIPLVPIANTLGFRLLAEEEAAWFPEKELRSAQDITPQRFTALERALLCLSVSTESLKSTDEDQPIKSLPSQNSHQPLLAQDSKKAQKTQSVKSNKSLGGGGGGGGGRNKAAGGGGGGDTPPHSSLKDGHLKGDGGKPLPRGRSEDRAAKRKDKVDKNNRNSM
ncbi:sodium-dependent neutral amino acid transporter B(0)AT3-like [Penaeus japonicus]|uniref:sodium-dependent neutral amino acid transporter B(0)AT3-like n=1 Tax=Penaeus japonicus TaxID=27405 RepID=UPI001C71722B|nr:sodium-dependent neutral amino acid transporter B(0)AT3-like [Penaeus japonicus]